MMGVAALLVLVAAALYLIVLGLAGLLRPKAAFGFLRLFAQTPRANPIEMVCRFAVGVAFLILAAQLPIPALFRALGVILALSALVSLALPSLHRRFADRVVPAIGRMMPVIGATSLAMGIGLAIILAPLMSEPPAPY